MRLGLFLVLGALTASCTKNDESTIVPIGTEYYIDDILSVIPDTLRMRFFADFGSIPEGPVPPKIEGSYRVATKQRVASNVESWPLEVVEPNMYLRFSTQHNELVKIDLNDATETQTDTVFVCGNGDAFAAYFIEDKAYDVEMAIGVFHLRMKRGVIVKGKMVNDGIADFRYATIIMESEDDSNGAIGQYRNGSYFIYKDGDGKAESFNW